MKTAAQWYACCNSRHCRCDILNQHADGMNSLSLSPLPLFSFSLLSHCAGTEYTSLVSFCLPDQQPLELLVSATKHTKTYWSISFNTNTVSVLQYDQLVMTMVIAFVISEIYQDEQATWAAHSQFKSGRHQRYLSSCSLFQIPSSHFVPIL